MAGKSVIKILIDGDASRLTRELDRSGSKLKQFAGSTVKSFAVMGAAVAAAGVAIGKKLIDAGERASTANARIQQVAESMGLFGAEAATVAARLVKLAEKTALMTGVDQNAIKMTQAKLLTFRELAETADVAGGAFDRATQAAIDMAAAGFGEAEQNAVQLGKALNDPIKGITALTRSGITFTEAEKEKIRTLVESGRMLDAQALILQAIETQVGGTAVATANASDRMKVAFSQLQERLGEKLLPVFERLTKFLIDRVIPGFEQLAKRWGPVLGQVFAEVGDIAEKLGAAFSKHVTPVLERVGRWMSENEDVVKVFFGVLIGGVAVGAVVALGAAIAALLSPAVAITAGVAALAAGVYYAYTRFETFRNIVDTVGRFFRDDFLPVAKRVFEFLVSFIGGTMNTIRGVIQTVVALIRGDWSGAWDGIKRIFTGQWDAMKAALSLALDYFRAVGGRLLSWLGDVVSGYVEMIGRVASTMVAPFRAAFNGIARLWNGTVGKLSFTVPSWVPVFGGKGWDVPDIPLLAEGGIVTKPTLAVIGEAGPEAVVPLSGRNAPTMASTSPMVVNIQTGADPNAVVEAIERYRRRNGSLPFVGVS